MSVCIAQAQTMPEDDLKSKGYDDLIALFEDNITDTLIATRIARVYIEKARADMDSTKMARGYQRLAFVSSKADAIKNLDTTIQLSKNSKHPNFPAIGYLFKSYYLYNVDKYEESLQNAITGYQYAKQKSNIDQQITALHQINGVNELWGDYEKALETELLTKELLFQNKNSELFTDNYIASLEGIGNCYVRLRKPDSALAYYKKGILESLKNEDSITYHAFVSKSGTALYVKGDYNAAIDSLQKAHAYKEYFINSYDTYYNFYMGSIFFQQGNNEKGALYFKKVDSIYERKQVLYPELPVVYDKLASFYRESENQEMQLAYMQKLVLVVKLIDVKRVYIKDKITEEYEIPKLLEEKDTLISGLKEKHDASQKKVWWIGGFLILSLLLLGYYVRRQKTFKKRFELLIAQREAPVEVTKPEPETAGASLDISEDIVAEILEHLAAFEAEKKFLSPKIKLTQLAKECNTNSTYLSKVINFKMGKNFSSYINELRVAYAFDELRDNPTFRKYTIKAVASECGFKSAESFSKAFYKMYGIYPSFYSKQLEQKRI
ncbi:AraC family transcriptional regulator [Rasiella rasia]|uniref:AraC family transcriptional regulator n=1 Tax=Rasiella rasia TaxID=2744027 RepID=A0A6G6GNK5_9FLAO|nr:helix-turn-helix domain-containing protein [Rasiella rasia]QIE60165.1 AraC family transcriptional regulator [Rasiella rasia]